MSNKKTRLFIPDFLKEKFLFIPKFHPDLHHKEFDLEFGDN